MIRAVVTGESMRPVLEPGDRLLLLPGWLSRRRVRSGDIVAAPDPRDERLLLIKKVVDADPDEVWLAGTNRSFSTDSRVFGAVPRRSIKGLVAYRYHPAQRAGVLRRRPTG